MFQTRGSSTFPNKNHKKQKEQAHHEATLASTTQQLAQLLHERQNFPPCISINPPERDNCDIIPQLPFDWPSVPHAELLPRIKTILTTPDIPNLWIFNIP
jgi:hypothetical protein